jgi:hypothetical protein
MIVLAVAIAGAPVLRADPSPAPAPVVVRQGTPIPDPPRAARPRPPAPDENPGAEIALEPLTHRCFVRDAAAFIDRTHVRCHNRTRAGFRYFAVDTAQPVAETLLVKAWKAMRTGKPLTVSYAPTAELNPSNCSARDCRRLLDATN